MAAIGKANDEITVVESTSPTTDKKDVGHHSSEIGKTSNAVFHQPDPEAHEKEQDYDDDNKVIKTGADAANHLLSIRDDMEPALTFRGIFLATCLSAFQAVMRQIYAVSVHLGAQNAR